MTTVNLLMIVNGIAVAWMANIAADAIQHDPDHRREIPVLITVFWGLAEAVLGIGRTLL